ncbi:hypothetical protein [Actinoplanes sp. CA-252034]|uniref:hypothetical protein n=1 Tax=Actinoplanes sp. CA-252034 TaxID=3239906 RepID=UPI003D986A6F
MRLLPVITGALVAGSVLAPAAAQAAIRFDPATNTGFIDAEDVRTAFGWDEAGLARNSPDIGFTYHVGKAANYSVVCKGGVRAETSHNPGSTSAGLTTVVTWNRGRLTGFRLTGATSGASSMNVAPEPGLPCPDERGGDIRSVSYLNTTVTAGLSAEFRDIQVYFPQERTVTTEPPEGYSAVSRTAWAKTSERCSKLRKRP